MTESNKKPIVLLLVDGWGIASANVGNAISNSRMPFLEDIIGNYPATILTSSFTKNIKTENNYTVLSSGNTRPGKKDKNLLELLSANNKKWAIITDPEKYSASTYFLFGKKRLEKSKIILVKNNLETNYFSNPETTSPFIAQELIKIIKKREFDFITATFSNLDIISRLGDFSTTVKAFESLDKLFKKIVKVTLENDAILIISSVVGKAENLIDIKTETINKKSTLNPVPFIVISKNFEGKIIGQNKILSSDISLLTPNGSLADIAPTILKLMDLSQPTTMTGKSLI